MNIRQERRFRPILLCALLGATFAASAQAPRETELRDVTVTSTRTERPVQDAPSSVTVIDSTRIEREAMRDIADVVRYEPNVSVGNNPGRFGPNSFTIRGIGGNRVLMQVDGIRVPDAFNFGSFGTASRNSVDIDAVKVIEIVRGPGSSLYGSDAIAGTVTFLTKDPADFMRLTDKPVFASVKGGIATADRSWTTTGTLAGGRGDLQGMVVYTMRDGHETKTKGSTGGTGATRTQANPQTYEDGNFLGKLVYRLNPNHSFKLTAERVKNDTRTDLLTLNALTPRTTTLNGQDESSRERVSLEHEFRNSGGMLFDLARWQVYHQDSQTLQNTYEQRAATTAACSGLTAGAFTCDFYRTFDYSQRTWGVGGQFEKMLGGSGAWSHHVVYGGDYSKTRTSELRNGTRITLQTGAVTSNINPDNFPVRDFPESDTVLAGAFVQDEIKNGPWSVIPGVRYDYYKLTPEVDAIFAADNPGVSPGIKKETAISPKLGVLYRMTPQYTLFGQYAHGFRAPPYNDVNSAFTNPGVYTAITNPNLKAERSRGLEAGLRGNFRNASFSLAGFYNSYRDFIVTQQQLTCPGDPSCVAGVPITFQSRNINNARIYGFEARGDYGFGNGFGVLGSVGYTYGEDTDRHQPINSIDPLKLVTGVKYDAPSRTWGTQLSGTFSDRKRRIDPAIPNPALVPSGGYAAFDLTSYVNFSKQLSLNLGLFNITDQKYILWSDIQGVGAGTAALPTLASMDRYSQPGRNLRANLKYQF